jgi:crotonobetainyl-CoA:carnitine CoA-transferase CaiB-like acyl-CoA transferase
MNIAFGMAAALFNRERTGRGTLVEASLLSSAMWTLSADVTLSQALSDADLARVAGEGRYALTRAYETSDGRWIQLMFLDPERYWPELCRRLERTDLLSDARFVTLDQRIEHGNDLITELAAAFKRHSSAGWRVKFSGWDAPWEVVQNIKELAADPQAKANGYLFAVQVADGTEVTVVAGPVAFNGSATPARPQRSPDLGQHNEELLRGIGVSAENLRELREKHIVS